MLTNKFPQNPDLIDELVMKVWNLQFKQTSLCLTCVTRVNELLQQLNNLHRMTQNSKSASTGKSALQRGSRTDRLCYLPY